MQYTKIFDAAWGPKENAVITHYQASRKVRNNEWKI